MKKYIAIAVAVVVLLGVVWGGYSLAKKSRTVSENQIQNVDEMKTITGSVTRVFEGNNVVNYSIDIPVNATTSVSMDGALVKMTEVDVPYATMYVSYEGARGYTPLDYLDQVVAPHVSVVTPTVVEHIGSFDWQEAESAGSIWHIASVANGNWLFVFENKKTESARVQKSLESFKAN